MSQMSSLDYKSIEIIKDRLYWISDRNPPKNQPNAFFFNIDSDLVYEPFFADFGPLDLGKTYRYITELEKLLKDPSYNKSKFYHHTSIDTNKRTNAACLMGCFQIIVLGRTAEEAWEPFRKLIPSVMEYRDASYTNSAYRCTILDCLRGLEYAIKLKWFNIKTFNLRDYEFYEKVENGDLNWIIPGKFIAFSGPNDAQLDNDGYRRFTPEDYVPIFKRMGVTMVIRLNNKQYDEERFRRSGIKHTDLYFTDGSCPEDNIVDTFLRICEQEKGAIAVHCKAGLGRTGTLIAAYAMKHYKFLAADFIGYIRLCRPGSVLGPQQQFLVDKQEEYHSKCVTSPLFKNVAQTVHDFHSKRQTAMEIEYERGTPKKVTEMSPLEKKIAKFGDFGQANRLLEAKHKSKSPLDSPVSNASEYSSVRDTGYSSRRESDYSLQKESSGYLSRRESDYSSRRESYSNNSGSNSSRYTPAVNNYASTNNYKSVSRFTYQDYVPSSRVRGWNN